METPCYECASMDKAAHIDKTMDLVIDKNQGTAIAMRLGSERNEQILGNSATYNQNHLSNEQVLH